MEGLLSTGPTPSSLLIGHIFFLISFFSNKATKLVGEGSVINGATPSSFWKHINCFSSNVLIVFIVISPGHQLKHIGENRANKSDAKVVVIKVIKFSLGLIINCECEP